MSKKNNKTKAALEVENRKLKQYNNAVAWASIIKEFIRMLMVVGTAAFMYLSVRSLAGKSTSASIAVQFIGNVIASHGMAYSLATGGVAYGLVQRKLKQRTVKKMQNRIKRLEKVRDAKRSSSRLTPSGETNPGDKE